MNVWLCYFSRSGRLAHVVDSLINASLEKKNAFSDCFFHFHNSLLMLQKEQNWLYNKCAVMWSSCVELVCSPHIVHEFPSDPLASSRSPKTWSWDKMGSLVCPWGRVWTVVCLSTWPCSKSTTCPGCKPTVRPETVGIGCGTPTTQGAREALMENARVNE